MFILWRHHVHRYSNVCLGRTIFHSPVSLWLLGQRIVIEILVRKRRSNFNWRSSCTSLWHDIYSYTLDSAIYLLNKRLKGTQYMVRGPKEQVYWIKLSILHPWSRSRTDNIKRGDKTKKRKGKKEAHHGKATTAAIITAWQLRPPSKQQLRFPTTCGTTSRTFASTSRNRRVLWFWRLTELPWPSRETVIFYVESLLRNFERRYQTTSLVLSYWVTKTRVKRMPESIILWFSSFTRPQVISSPSMILFLIQLQHSYHIAVNPELQMLYASAKVHVVQVADVGKATCHDQ